MRAEPLLERLGARLSVRFIPPFPLFPRALLSGDLLGRRLPLRDRLSYIFRQLRLSRFRTMVIDFLRHVRLHHGLSAATFQ
ncbi:Hypothetical protein CAP_1305 [Chondromyces apiculatus DSM 436]|uniref:Uncharacterized protein n=1 Tax=Chondromyces apiculatus DSM 436 TaxID=1192034 RepID=A0A017TER0_9BACT|nr:Hypothetical protein CAP_1305 [Chondromyces apiculatus DSM 436]